MSAAAPPSLASLVERLHTLGVADEVGPELEAVRADLALSVTQLDAANAELAEAATELETTSTELRRAADELTAMDVEVRARSAEVERGAAVLQVVIDGLAGPVLVVDADQRVRAWSAAAAARWGHERGEVVGRVVGRLDLGGDAAAVAALARRVLAAGGAEERDDALGARACGLPEGGAVVSFDA